MARSTASVAVLYSLLLAPRNPLALLRTFLRLFLDAGALVDLGISVPLCWIKSAGQHQPDALGWALHEHALFTELSLSLSCLFAQQMTGT